MSNLHLPTDVKFSAIQDHFADLDGKLDNKHLRFDAQRGLHLHTTMKSSGLGADAASRRQAKHDAAFESVKAAIDRQVGSGMGEYLLRNVLGEKQFKHKEIAVSDLATIGTQIDNLTRDDRIDMLVQKLSIQVGTEAAQEIGHLLQQDRSIDIAKFSTQIVAHGDVALPLNVAQLRRDLASEMGVMQVMAKHGMIDTLVPNLNNVNIRLATAPDNQAFNYDGLRGCIRLVGTGFLSQNGKGFLECRTTTLDDRLDSGEIVKTADKLHLSVDSRKVAQSWNLVCPILMKYSDVVPEFKCTDIETVVSKTYEAKRQLNNPNLTADKRKDLEEKVESGKRVVFGAQITLYVYSDNANDNGARVKAMLGEINQVLQQNGIASGTQPDTDHAVNDYASYRFEKRTVETADGKVGSALFSDSPDYAAQKQLMVNQPLYQTLIS